MAIKKLKINYRTQKKNIDQYTNLKPQKKQWTQTDQTIDTTRNPEHIYLKLLTPLTPCVEKVMNFHGQLSL